MMNHESPFSIFSNPFSADAWTAIATLDCASCLFSTDTVQIIRYTVGIFGNVFNLLLYTSPIVTFQRVVKNKSTEEFSIVPYVAALLNSVLYALYGSPLASDGWDNLPLFTVNGTGVLMEVAFICIFFWFATPRKKVIASFIMAPVIIFLSVILVLSTTLHDHHLRKTILGSFGFFCSVSMYGSPLVAVKRVLETKSVEFMPLNLSLFSFLTTSAWMAYGLLSYDVLLASPNFLGVPLGILQLVVYYKYRKNKGRSQVDLEKTDEEVPDLTTPLIVNSTEN